MSIKRAAARPPQKTVPPAKARPKPIADVLGKERQGEAPTEHEISRFLDTYLSLDALERRHTLVDLQKAAAEGKDEPAKTLRPWRAATPQACVKVLTGEKLGDARRTTEARLEKSEAELAAVSVKRQGLEARSTLSPQERKELSALKAQQTALAGECAALRELGDSLARIPRRRPFQDTGFSLEVAAEGSLFLGAVNAGAGVFVEQRDLETGKRHVEPMLTASAKAKVFAIRGVLGTEHRGIVKEYGAGVSVAKDDPFLPGKVELDVGIASILSADGGAIGAAAEVPIPFAPQLYPFGSLNVRVTVKDPRFEPVSVAVADKIEWGQEKLNQALEPVKKVAAEVKEAVSDALRDDGEYDDPAGWIPGF